MKVLLAVPRYSFIWPSAEQWEMEALVHVAGAGHEVGWIPPPEMSGHWIDEARERACERAVAEGFGVLVMVDADQYLSGAETVRLVEDCWHGRWALLGAPYQKRRAAEQTWQQPSLGVRATEADVREMVEAIRGRRVLPCRGFVGTGICALRVDELEGVPRPWFFRGGVGPEGEDVWYCRRAVAAGKRVGVHFGLRSGEHWGGFAHRSERMLDAIVQTFEREGAAAMLRRGWKLEAGEAT